jgi:hypothetical protein
MSDRTDSETRDEQRGGDYDRNTNEEDRWASAIIALAGIWLLIEPFLLDPIIAGNRWNDIIVGLLLLALGGYNYYRRTNDRLGSTAAAGLAALIGLWLLVAPWVYGIDAGGGEIVTELGFWNDVIVGLVVLALGVFSVHETRDTDVATPASR